MLEGKGGCYLETHPIRGGREPHVRTHAKQALRHDIFTKSCRTPTETFAGGGGQKTESFQPTTGGPGTDCRSQNSTRGPKFKKPKSKKRAHRKQNRTHGPTVLPATACQARIVPPCRDGWPAVHAKLVSWSRGGVWGGVLDKLG